MGFKINIPKEANELIHILQSNGHSAYVVGGCVRDSILYRNPNDWDICTSATPEDMLEIFKDKKIIETGLQHGTVTVVVNGDAFEITTYRIDGNYSDNRRPDSVEFTNSLIEDLKRRDFTINAMAYNDEEGLIDPFGGLYDIKKRIIRCVGYPEDRFNEDALRILRAIRFSCQLGFCIDASIGWCIGYTDIKENLKNISVERINSEFCKMIVCGNFHNRLVKHYSLFTLFIPELKDMIDFKQNNPWHIYDVFEHTFYALKHCKTSDLIVKLAVLFHDIGKPHSYQDGEDGVRHFKGHGKVSADMTNEIMKRLKFDNDTREKVVELVYYHDSFLEVGKKYIKRWLNKIGMEQFQRLLKVRKADIKSQNPEFSQERLNKVDNIEKLLEEILQEKECFSLKDLVINGNDVKNILHLKEGKDVGFWLNKILNLVIDGELNNNKEDLIYWMTGVCDGWIKF